MASSIVDKEKREVVTDENGDTYLRYYDSEFKMWINIRNNPDNTSGTKYLTKKNIFRQI